MRYELNIRVIVSASEPPQEEDFHLELDASADDIGVAIEAEWWEIEEYHGE
jgi:hypothetical protein